MTYNVKNIWILSMLLSEILKQVNLQYALSIFGPPIYPIPYYIVPAPMPILVPEPTKVTSTTLRNPPCPPCVCLPSCTPAFFSYCSLCHQKCRCKSAKDTPDPMPSDTNFVYAMPVPMPPVIGSPPVAILIPEQDSSESTLEYTDTSSSDSY
ncbi:uncharacterized protein LOC124535391 [Vanessa cardui]|uniref:uncharacterized protein LOC124535391 n=1 Tax=Vanessa cardui TaxID=171605 RepID=UPI001F136294|nr:uncharacterized protein LOC124535391 [Vanessa cardui]